MYCFFFFFKQKTAYEMRISDWSSDVCSSDLHEALLRAGDGDIDAPLVVAVVDRRQRRDGVDHQQGRVAGLVDRLAHLGDAACAAGRGLVVADADSLDRVRLVT